MVAVDALAGQSAIPSGKKTSGEAFPGFDILREQGLLPRTQNYRNTGGKKIQAGLPATIRQTCATRKQMRKPKATGMRADTAVHLALRVSFQIV